MSTPSRLLALLLMVVTVSWLTPGKNNPAVYQLTVYQYLDSAQEKILDDYLSEALLPALHKLKYEKTGVFKALANDTSLVKKIYVLIKGSSVDELAAISGKLNAVPGFKEKAAAYTDAVYNHPPYGRMEVIYLRAFPMAPGLETPALKSAKNERVYELRSYESATEKIFRNKVHMFNEGGEIALFKRLNFNAIFYSEVIAGARMPNLMYMTSFENMADRDAHWKAFSSDPEWKKLSALPEYQKNVSHIDISFLRPTGYSDY
jgi:hypothetical protein